jgi:hypothetical protein
VTGRLPKGEATKADRGSSNHVSQDQQSPPWVPPYVEAPLTGETSQVSGPGPRRWVAAAVGAVAAGVLLTGGAAWGVDAYAKQSFCTKVANAEESQAAAAGIPADRIDFAAIERSFRSTSRLLFFHPDLREAADGLAHDAGRLRTLSATADVDNPSPDLIREVTRLVSSIDAHARQAQTGCDLPINGFTPPAA